MPEIVDICDSEGHLTKETTARSEAHRLELWHRVALVWVINSKGEILLQQRAEHLGSFPGLWDVSVDGHVSSGDEPTPTAIRELREELGIEAEPQELRFADVVSDRYLLTYGKTHQEHDFVFTLHHDVKIEDLKLQAAEVLAAEWKTADDLERDLQDHPAKYAARNPHVYQLGINAARNQSKAPQE